MQPGDITFHHTYWFYVIVPGHFCNTPKIFWHILLRASNFHNSRNNKENNTLCTFQFHWFCVCEMRICGRCLRYHKSLVMAWFRSCKVHFFAQKELQSNTDCPLIMWHRTCNCDVLQYFCHLKISSNSYIVQFCDVKKYFWCFKIVLMLNHTFFAIFTKFYIQHPMKHQNVKKQSTKKKHKELWHQL